MEYFGKTVMNKEKPYWVSMQCCNVPGLTKITPAIKLQQSLNIKHKINENFQWQDWQK